ncbi:sialate O-acetylesterase [Coraliomargarita parva]|uniref:sialate O-acetylesterase n=1 Tax=Coraliomargarita parva TaxID=3014050 RepID=UPI0022B3E5D1|nr:sialate O-acetylesterase [Coraliomargarita parva]
MGSIFVRTGDTAESLNLESLVDTTVRFHPAFTDHMVLQRDVPVRVSGQSMPHSAVSVTLGEIRVQGESDETGHWQLMLPPLAASAEHCELTLESAGQRVALHDVLVGEVWFCSGQSNMEFELRRVHGAENVLPLADNPQLRLLNVTKNASEQMLDELHGQAWVLCTPETASDFSAVAYYFGRELQERLDVPVGVIHASWGGTRIESWMSRESLEANSCVKEQMVAYDKLLADSHANRIMGVCQRPPQLEGDPLNSPGRQLGWGAPEFSVEDWPQMELPTQWQNKGYQQSGVFWFRRDVEIPADWVGHDLQLSLGAIDKSDVTHWNGTPVGSTPISMTSYREPRFYTIPASQVRAGRNTIAVRVRSEFFDGGMTGPAEAITVSCPGIADASPLPLAGLWRFQVENDYGYRSPYAPTELFNGMIAPYLDYTIRGVAWYQGESNKSDPLEYEVLLKAFIADLRERWGCGALPVLIVQLVHGTPPSLYEPNSGFAAIREVQQSVAENMSSVQLISAMDIVEYSDAYHPSIKEPVGKRLAIGAMSLVNGLPENPEGPAMKAIYRVSSSLRVVFDNKGSSLKTNDGAATAKGFVLAGPDGVFHPAEGKIEGNSVLVNCPEVPEPRALFYAWADNPICNLYNEAGYPASPFRWISAAASF